MSLTFIICSFQCYAAKNRYSMIKYLNTSPQLKKIASPSVRCNNLSKVTFNFVTIHLQCNISPTQWLAAGDWWDIVRLKIHKMSHWVRFEYLARPFEDPAEGVGLDGTVVVESFVVLTGVNIGIWSKTTHPPFKSPYESEAHLYSLLLPCLYHCSPLAPWWHFHEWHIYIVLLDLY